MKNLILYGGTVITADARGSVAEAVVVSGERIRFVGSSREALAMAGAGTEKVDLSGRTVLPGFNDNHLHALAMGDFAAQPNLSGMGCDEIIDFLREHYRDIRPGEWITAHSWDYPSCYEPHRELLDEAFPENPVALLQFSGHAAWVNTPVLRLLGIGSETPDPPGGKILRDSSGEPTGILLDTAITRLHMRRHRRHNLNLRVGADLLRNALRLFREAGITSVQDNTWFPTGLLLMRSCRLRGCLTTRFTCWAYGRNPALAASMNLPLYDSRWVRKGPIKYFLDGAFSTKSAWLLEPYRGEPDNIGKGEMEYSRLLEVLRAGARRNRQLAFHAIGDRAVRQLVDAVQEVSREHPNIRDLRIRIEHGQLIHPDDIPRIRDLGIHIAAQPSALITPEKDAGLIGEERARNAYPYRSLLDAGVPLSFGSDIPGEAIYRPLDLIRLAVGRDSPERISVEEAIRAYTAGSARVEFMEQEKGTIETGRLADLTVLSEDPRAVPPDRFDRIRVEMTVTGGRTVYRREAEQG